MSNNSRSINQVPYIVINTGRNHSVLIPSKNETILTDVTNVDVSNGGYIGVFNASDECFGLTKYEEDKLTGIAVMGNDPTTFVTDGFSEDDEMNFKFISMDNNGDKTELELPPQNFTYTTNAINHLVRGVPITWEVTETDNYQTIAIDSITIDDTQVVNGSAVGVFFINLSGISQCVGYTVVTDDTTVVTDDTTKIKVYGDVDYSTETFTWMIWDTVNEFTAAANGTVYNPNGSITITSLTAEYFQTLEIPSGWSIFSTYIDATTKDVISIIDPIVDKVVIVKNSAGLSYLPELGFNAIGDLEVGQGYLIKTTEAVSLKIYGVVAKPEENPIILAEGWNIIGYLRKEPADTIKVFADIHADGNLIIVKDSTGKIYLPEWDYNGIGDMKPGDGYQLKVLNNGTLTYLSNDESY